MHIRNSIWTFAHTFIKRDIIGLFTKSHYGKFGSDSRIYKPLIHDRHRNNIFIGNNSHIGPYSRIQCFADSLGKLGSLSIGDNCRIGQRVTILVGGDIYIGDYSLIASDVLITSENHSIDPENKEPYMSQQLKCAPVEIKSGCWIGEKAVILPGVTIGEKSIIAAGAIVTRNVPDYSIVAGVPAKIIKQYDFVDHSWKSVK